MIRKLQVATLSFLIALGIAAVANAAVSVPVEGEVAKVEPFVGAEAPRFERWAASGALYSRYDALLAKARDLDVAPEATVFKQAVVTQVELRQGLARLGGRIAEAKKAAAIPRAEGGTIEGVSLATLNAIAACESGGDPTAVNDAGYFGKYQFDTETWAAVGGSGNPADASEAEQDYRAALLYSRAGSSPWPVCGV